MLTIQKHSLICIFCLPKMIDYCLSLFIELRLNRSLQLCEYCCCFTFKFLIILFDIILLLCLKMDNILQQLHQSSKLFILRPFLTSIHARPQVLMPLFKLFKCGFFGEIRVEPELTAYLLEEHAIFLQSFLVVLS